MSHINDVYKSTKTQIYRHRLFAELLGKREREGGLFLYLSFPIRTLLCGNFNIADISMTSFLDRQALLRYLSSNTCSCDEENGMRGRSSIRRFVRLSTQDLLGSLGGLYRVYWSHVRSVPRASGRVAPTRKASVVSTTSLEHSSLRRGVSPSRSSLASGGKRLSTSSPPSSSRSTRDLGEEPRSSDSIRAILKSVFLIRASLVIPDVSLNLPRKLLLVLYIYIACARTHTRVEGTGVSLGGRVPLVFATRILSSPFSLSLSAANPN